MMLILEYVPHGDLLGCLRKSRGMDDQYYSSPENFQEEITSYDLLSFAQQIAYGMSFLASKKVWYNILICEKHLKLQRSWQTEIFSRNKMFPPPFDCF